MSIIEGAMYISLWENSRGHPDNALVLCNFLRTIDGFEQKDSQGFENSYNSGWTIPIREIFPIYSHLPEHYTLSFNMSQ